VLKVARGSDRRPGNYREGDHRTQRVSEFCADREQCEEDERQQRIAQDAYRLVELDVLIMLAHQVYYEVDAQAAGDAVTIDRTKVNFALT